MILVAKFDRFLFTGYLTSTTAFFSVISFSFASFFLFSEESESLELAFEHLKKSFKLLSDLFD
jgi:hypothetical protein